MKVAVFADLHFGVRGDANVFLDHQRDAFVNKFWPELQSQPDIKTIILAGDIVDRRKYINFKTAKMMREVFFEPLQAMGYDVHAIPGNHDCYHKNTNETNALNELMGNYNFKIYNEPGEAIIHDRKFLMLPWICDENKDASMHAITTSDASYVIAHLELSGFEMYRGMICEHGMDSSIFDKFQAVLTGHFHKPSNKNNIHYLGAPYQMTWGDWADERGYNLLDLDNGALQFIPNTKEMFHKVVYNDSGRTFEEVIGLEFDAYKGTFVKIIVEKKTNSYWFDLFLEKMNEKAFDCKVVDMDVGVITAEVDIKTTDDTSSILRASVQKSEFSVDKEKLERFVISLYNEALNVSI